MTSPAGSGLTALVIGATGAIGQALTEQLVAHAAFKKVITVGRRPVDLGAKGEGAAGSKLEQVTVDMDKMETAQPQFSQADVVFCALGTTRGVAGSAEQFKKVDHDYVAKAAELAKAGGVKHYSLVTAQGANPNVWASDVKIFHPFLYTKTKGLAEEAVKSRGFAATSIFRPGLLDRGEMARGMEKALYAVAPSMAVKVSDVAKVMIADAVRQAKQQGQCQQPGSSSSGGGTVAVFEMKAIQAAAKANVAPTPSA